MKFRDIYERIIFRVRNQGLLSLLKITVTKAWWFFFPPRSEYLEQIHLRIKNKKGLETGGPSPVFSSKGFVPLYDQPVHIDNMNFASETIWEGEIRSTSFSADGLTLGKQYIGEASDLSQFPDKSYDFILSSEMIQHIANPVKALYEWKRVLVDGGVVILLIPNKEKTFDHRRPLTTLQHMIDDFKNDMSETDLTHLDEALKYHDLSLDRPAGTYEQFKRRSEQNHLYRALHHHVFTLDSAKELIEYAGFSLLWSEYFRSAMLFVLEKRNPDSSPE